MYSFEDLADSQNLQSCQTIPPKTVLIFIKNFLDFRLDMVEKYGIINLSSYSIKGYASVFLIGSEVVFLKKG